MDMPRCQSLKGTEIVELPKQLGNQIDLVHRSHHRNSTDTHHSASSSTHAIRRFR